MTAERLLKVYEQISEAPDAIARLRRFVLDLAVRGKLVEQDAGDEPATRQLVRIAEAKSQLDLKERKTKKKAVDPSITELAFDLPLGWDEARLSDLVRVVNGRAYKKSELLSEGTPVLRVGNLFTSDYWYYSDLELEDDKYCDEGDLIYAWSASFGPFIWSGPRAIFHYHIWKLPLFSEKYLSKNFVYLFLQQKTREIKDAGHGISMIHMTKEKMEQLAVPVPPIAEQHRIVAKVDELMALCDRLEEARKTREETRDKLTAASLARLTAPDTTSDDFPTHANFALEALPALTTRPDQIKTLRQSILNLAVRGKLVEQDPADEPASELLEAIEMKRRELIKAGEIRKQKPMSALESKEIPFYVPHAWTWCRLGSLVLSSDAGWSPRTENHARQGDAWGVLKVSAVSWDHFDPEANKQVLKGTEPRLQAQVRINDFLISRANTAELVARAALVIDEPHNLMMSDKIVRLRLAENCDHRFVWLVNNNADYARKYYASNATGVSPSMKNVSRAVILNLPIPLPPIAEQHRIVAKVDTLMALCDRLEAALATTDTTRTRLLEALLHEALEPSQNALEAAE
ncbi:type I restriction enzyme, S subunit [Roseovarius pacificus]|uniref:Type I restriction enzyme, S subunit n=1 Tax=Roseovarius pacificus TaxID=337701 RepID=A0A1M7FUN8_9RHOB|nr:restriction endonuclease subunit S [Roseovarius pacificus]GGO59473.1 type I restriction endonuclease EcoAI subunit S [Roseovarius pacificus]SHM07716.1 type I restriction enzyme, S subunit [Roseovarius pacificus]